MKDFIRGRLYHDRFAPLTLGMLFLSGGAMMIVKEYMQLGRINFAGIEIIFLAVGALLTAAGIYLISFFKKHKEYIPENAFFKAYEESRKSTGGLNEISRKHK